MFSASIVPLYKQFTCGYFLRFFPFSFKNVLNNYLEKTCGFKPIKTQYRTIERFKSEKQKLFFTVLSQHVCQYVQQSQKIGV
jgi:hypothetical protein